MTILALTAWLWLWQRAIALNYYCVTGSAARKKYAVLFCRKSQFWSRLFGMSRTESGRSGKYNFFNALTYVCIHPSLYLHLFGNYEPVEHGFTDICVSGMYRVRAGFIFHINLPTPYLINKVGSNYLSCLLSVINCQWGGNSLMYEIITAVEVELFIAERLIL